MTPVSISCSTGMPNGLDRSTLPEPEEGAPKNHLWSPSSPGCSPVLQETQLQSDVTKPKTLSSVHYTGL
jgi:hypothetical protein|eukprot:CAMPEP_0174383498 /NCGR_PEP_ID=MMETSP0811_2-20130205/125276_1 /TAXON_ID=73025 ORGANISM="Eutreptiella gymnastica-like, Strain CCMP1594" /NCGR_SAMPLE_ID=MMETSP0811_2 /ASSEMBLY_ACC=CAM_ASM_000667 /LENGTH=68 /DNA_ID=CAMNT_0015537105 /DNA_START=615 /DNA_END=821 /DNA_ORIENTATION=+